MAVEILLDVRDLLSPVGLEVVLGALDELREGHYLRVVHRDSSQCLCELTDRLGFDHLLRPTDESTFNIFIWLSTDHVAALTVQKVTDREEPRMS